jgi:hypothetical protein
MIQAHTNILSASSPSPPTDLRPFLLKTSQEKEQSKRIISPPLSGIHLDRQLHHLICPLDSLHFLPNTPKSPSHLPLLHQLPSQSLNNTLLLLDSLSRFLNDSSQPHNLLLCGFECCGASVYRILTVYRERDVEDSSFCRLRYPTLALPQLGLQQRCRHVTWQRRCRSGEHNARWTYHCRCDVK